MFMLRQHCEPERDCVYDSAAADKVGSWGASLFYYFNSLHDSVFGDLCYVFTLHNDNKHQRKQ